MTHIISARATIRGIHEHTRTMYGKRDPVTQAAVTEHISLGWFIHLDFGPESGPMSFSVGPHFPSHISVGDEVIMTIFKPSRVQE